MNAQELYEKVFMLLQNGKHPSLPFILQEEKGKKVVTWFYYTAKEDGQDLLLSIRQVVTADGNLDTQIYPAKIEMRKEVREFSRERMAMEDYYEELAQLYEDFDEDKMKNLLAQAELAPLLGAYEKVTEFVKQQEALPETEEDKDEETDEELIKN